MVTSRFRLVVVGLVSLGFGLVGCGDPPPTDDGDAGCVGADCSDIDSGSDEDFDAGSDEDFDAGTDADVDAGSDADVDAGSDADVDAGTDAGPPFVPVRWSETDHDPHVFFDDDRLRVENRGEDRGNARSDASIAPGSGVFYFEAQRLIETAGYWGIGVATAAAHLTGWSSEFDPNVDNSALGLQTQGQFQAHSSATCTGTMTFPSARSNYGFVIDYRGVHPTIHFVLDDGAGGLEIRRTCTPAITDPVFIFYDGVRNEVGYQLAINTGADTQNRPFHFALADLKNALVGAGEASAAAALVYGFGATRALPPSGAPTITAPTDMVVAAGTTVQLTGSASDAEDGDLTASLVWTDLSSQHHAPLTGTGGSFSFVATLGRHPVRMRVEDSVGRVAEQVVLVQATGSVLQYDPVVMALDPLSGTDTTISADGLSVDTHSFQKHGVRANQAIYGQYWYFEAHRNGIPANVGVGLVIPDGNLDPYSFVDVPWSMSVNILGSTWRNLISLSAFTSGSADTYGFAVDYRGEHPNVHILVGTSSGATFHRTVPMPDVWGPIHPMVYGNPWYDTGSGQVDPGDEITMNFGATPFVFDPVAVLAGAGVDVSGLEVGWGDANTPP